MPVEHMLFKKEGFSDQWSLIVYNLARLSRNCGELSRYKWIGSTVFGNPHCLHNQAMRINQLTESAIKIKLEKEMVKELIFCFKYQPDKRKSVIDRIVDYIIYECRKIMEMSIIDWGDDDHLTGWHEFIDSNENVRIIKQDEVIDLEDD